MRRLLIIIFLVFILMVWIPVGVLVCIIQVLIGRINGINKRKRS